MGFKNNFRQALQLPRPPLVDKPNADKPGGGAPEDKLSALRTFRHARGLCEVCAEKWVRGHKCAATIQLHAMQEIWNMFPEEDDDTEPFTNTEPAPEQLLLALSHDAQMGSQGHRTIQFNGFVHGHAVVILVDSGSSASFIAASVAVKLSRLLRVPLNAQVKIANGQLLQCTTAIADCQFFLGDYSFQHDLRVLQLDSYDLILGMDWLERYSPMQVH
jgi:predicted aspartyl protease